MRIVPSEQVQALGHCVYTTLRIHAHQLLYWDGHMERLKSSMDFFGMQPEIHPELKSWIEAQTLEQGLCRITVTETEVMVSFRGFKPIPEKITVMLTDQVVHPVLGLHKTGNHLPYALAAKEVQQSGAFEGLMWDASEQFVVDGTRAGFLLQKNGLFFQPLGGLPSVTRDAALREMGIQAEHVWVTREDLFSADRLWLCGSGMGILPVDTLKDQGEERNFTSSPLPVRSVGLIPPRAPVNR
ncbi:aminotransferase class IV [Deinococcus cellulosilyticus]|uniref:4-amino-4-deoxychorismate lyase n=1 Tax=Deinococcus cellulosilyticus (strain DSM 18568 / NBRC 106333 / KACC 11606 / 5516J-15) TaxID=1223518 RepID=A0A511N2S2_DEIC1|nr:aminotransferase class IV [Deinococcus cellulosilyticus]GEM47144.1 4-amino-4-deoxychorismate lyase [Deinococcus cellulosilyticus NBRC 106333 = KACC 11606]